MRFGSLFSGIGGLDLGLERAGMRVAWQCEIDPYCRSVLAHHWPGVACYNDIRAIDEFAERVDLICGGFPCQPVSLAGKGLAQKDPRWLWPEFARVVGLLRPRYVLVENVPGLIKRGLADVVGDLAALGYDAEWQIVSAASVGAPHLRERVIVVAYPGSPGRWEDPGSAHAHEGDQDGIASQDDYLVDGDGEGDRAGEVSGALADCAGLGEQRQSEPVASEQCSAGRRGGFRGDVQDADSSTVQPWRLGWRTPQAGGSEWWAAEPDVGRVAHGVPSRLDRLACLGNAVVPQVAEFVGRLILEAEEAISVAA